MSDPRFELLPLGLFLATGCFADPVDGGKMDENSTGAEASTQGPEMGTSTTADPSATATSGDTSSGPDPVGSSTSGTDETSSGTDGPICGDGVLQPGEECDDGNDIANDGCEATCIVSGVAQVSVGRTHACVLTRGQTVRCFGQSTHGELGYGNLEAIGDDEAPYVAGDIDIGDVPPVYVGAGLRHSCALLEDGSVKCWGDAQSGRLGYATPDDVGDDEVPADVGAVDVGGTVVQLSVGDQHNCAVLEDGSVRCWGLNFQGAVLGYGAVGDIGDDETPADVGDVPFGDTVIEQVSAGFSHTCAVSNAGEVFCWGTSEFGKLGTGSLEPVPVPLDTPAQLDGDARRVLAGSVTTCALMLDDDVLCWGRGAYYTLGNQMVDDIGDDEAPNAAGEVPLGFNAQQVVGEGYHLCALSEAGAVQCWGSPLYGRLGSGNGQIIGDDELPSDAPAVAIGGTALQISADIESTCAVRDDHQLVCWGRNDDGRIGIPGGQDVGDDESPVAAGPVAILEP